MKLKGLATLLILASTLFEVGSAAGADTSWEKFRCSELKSKPKALASLPNQSYDVVIYGGTPSGSAAARAAAELGKSVLLLSETSLFGGSISNGVSATDLGSEEANVGLAKTYLEDVSNFYHTQDYRTEPKVAECIFLNWLDRDNIDLVQNVELVGVSKNNLDITGLRVATVGNPKVSFIGGKTFIDASYAGDLTYLSGTPTRLGMSDYFSYHENVTKKRTLTRQFKIKSPSEIAKAEEDFSRLPHVTIRKNLKNYKEIIQGGMPSFTYRLCVTKNQENLIPFKKTKDYETFAPAWRTWMKNYFGFKKQNQIRTRRNGTVLTQLWRMAALPNQKYDLNSYYSSFTNFVLPRKYFANIDSRQDIYDLYQSYMSSFLYFVQNDDSVPTFESKNLSGFGLCADEFTNNHGWPEMPYIREGRRLVGKTTLTSKDLLVNREKSDAIAVGSYVLDSKPTVFVYSKGKYVRDIFELYKMPMYEIPFSAMVPKNGLRNLIVSVGLSSSPSAFASLRMEPQFIQLGQAAGTAAALAVDRKSGFTKELVGFIRNSLKDQDGFVGIREICNQMEPSHRARWGFDISSCQITDFPLRSEAENFK